LEEVIEALCCGGLANIKGDRPKRIFDEMYIQSALKIERKSFNEEAKYEPMGCDWVGPKSASCVPVFCLARDSFVVDTLVV
jgi:endonuclease III